MSRNENLWEISVDSFRKRSATLWAISMDSFSSPGGEILPRGSFERLGHQRLARGDLSAAPPLNATAELAQGLETGSPDFSAWLPVHRARCVRWHRSGELLLLDAMSRGYGWAVVGWARRGFSMLSRPIRRAAPCGPLGMPAWSDPVAICGGLRDCRARLPAACEFTFSPGSSDHFAGLCFDTPKHFGKQIV